MPKYHIGTSGWVYYDWVGRFYPEGLPSSQRLKFFSKEFATTEINYSFYHLPRPNTFQNWYQQTPEGFIFAVKVSRFITHIKRLKRVGQAWRKFYKNALHLKEKLGPILFQFPPSFKIDLKRLEAFLRLHSPKARYAFEFRHPSWMDERVYKLLKKYNAAWVIADSPRYPKAEVLTADFAYIRMHGSTQLFASKYTKGELEELAGKIKKWGRGLKAVYVYFNNDFQGHAVEDARELRKLLSDEAMRL